MKFGNGCWLQKEGYECFPPQQIYFTKIEPKKVTLCAPTSRISHRGDTLGGINLTLEITSPMPEVLRVKTYHHLGIRKTGPDFELETQENVELEIEDSDEKICIKSGSLSLTITKENFSMEYARDGEVISKCNGRDLAFMKTDWKGYVYDKGSKDAYMRQQLSLSVGELVYGMGERFTPFVKNGQTVDIWNEDGGTSTYQSYKNISFYLTNKGYGVFVNNPGDVSFEVATEQVSKVQFSVSGECLDYFFINGPTMKEVLAHYTGITGKPSLPAQWTFGLWLSTSFTTNYDEETVMSFINGMEKGYFIKRTNGDVWQWDMWQPGMAIVDFTNPQACQWFKDKLAVLVDMGVDCFKTDFGERIPTEDVVYYDGADPVKMHNYYTYLYNKVVYELLEEKKGKEEAVLFARSASVGGQKFPVHWGGDCWSTYEAMAESLRGGLSLTMSGFGFWSHDIGGFENTSTADVYKRWAAFGLLSTHSRLHGSTSYRVPWAYDDKAVDVVRYFTKLKMQLLPYIYSNAAYTAKTGVPTMRSMVLEFEKDPTCAYLDRQYMLGGNILTAPIFREDGIANYYLPAGAWTNYLTGETREGGVWVEEHHDYLFIPLWVRENSIIPVCNQMERDDDAYDKTFS